MNATGITNVQTLMQWNNTVTGDMFGLSILLMLFSISFLTMHGFGNKPSFVASIWLTAIASVFLWILQLINAEIMIGVIMITALASVFLFRTREN